MPCDLCSLPWQPWCAVSGRKRNRSQELGIYAEASGGSGENGVKKGEVGDLQVKEMWTRKWGDYQAIVGARTFADKR